jgi:hypothetical protein
VLDGSDCFGEGFFDCLLRAVGIEDERVKLFLGLLKLLCGFGSPGNFLELEKHSIICQRSDQSKRAKGIAGMVY